MITKENKNLDKEFKFYLANQEELLKKYDKKFLVIKDEKVIGSYETATEAYTAGSSQFEVGTFLIQFCSAGSASYTQTFHSRVVFK